MREIATLALLARNDKGIPHGIASLVALARNDKGIPHEIAALVALARNDIITCLQLCVYVMSKNYSYIQNIYNIQ